LTDYDEEIPLGHKTLVEYLLQSSYLDLDDSNEEKHFLISSTPDPNGLQEDDERYTILKEIFELKVTETRERVKNSMKYRELTNASTELDKENISNTDHVKKKRKIMKELKSFTGNKLENEKAFRGWSTRGYSCMGKCKVKIERENHQYSKFDTAYRYFYSKHMKTGGEKEDTESEMGSEEEEDFHEQLFDFRGTK
jgi:hypothetical protein